MRRIGPGPAKYDLPTTIGLKNRDIRKKFAPSYIIGERLKTRADAIGPGPAKYDPGEYTRHGKDYHAGYIGQKIKLNVVNPNPAPNAYNLPNMIGADRPNVYKNRSPEYPIGQKINCKFTSITPAPNTYNLPHLIGPDSAKSDKIKAPSYLIGVKLNELQKSITPGPNKYYPELKNPRKLHTSILPRRPHSIKSHVPAPNAYNLQPHKPGRKEPAYSIGNKYPDWMQPLIVEADNL